MDTSATEPLEATLPVDFQLLATPEGRANPYPHYHALRIASPVYRSDLANGWLLSSYDDCFAVLRDHRFVKGYVADMDARRPDWRERPALVGAEHWMLNLDGEEHLRLRRPVMRTFTRRTVDELRPQIEQFVDGILDRMADSKGGDLMTQLAFPLSVRVIGELLGVPEEDHAPFRQRMKALSAIFEFMATPEMLDAADVAQLESSAYFSELIQSKRSVPGDDLLSRLVHDDTEAELDADELCSLALLVFAAGFETSTNLIGNAMLGLLAHPDQMTLLRSRPQLFSELPDELLRYDGTVQVTARLAIEQVEIRDTVIPAGDPVFPILGAGNRDPARFDRPDTLDVTRSDVRPLTFGGGVHMCLGAALARAEIEIVFRKLLERFASIELVEEAPYRDSLTLRGPEQVLLSLSCP